MTTESKYRVLVAEDDPFQRMSIVDILKISKFDVTTVENGTQALEKLMNKTNHFDLILLDLIMPEKSGKDVLEAIMEDSDLCKLPVIVMSAKNDKNIISECLKAGAKSFIVKPLRVQECRGFENFICSSGETEAEKNLGKYITIKSLGSGAAGSVDLVKHKETGKEFALKTIPLSSLNEEERKSAECEVHFLRVLVGPTLIKAHQSYVEKDKIYIIMEYAEGGSLADKILYARINKRPFDSDTILNWIAQIILGVMLMHSKNILHRDLKCQNLFLTKDNIVKIGDFGISKKLDTLSSLARTAVGTPYFMAPEVCRGEAYGEKADIWAIGVILYELAMLRKPFDADSMVGVFDKIIKEPIDLTNASLETDLRMLIMAMLDKDPSRRPSVWDLADYPSINDRIYAFLKENGLEGKENVFTRRPGTGEESKDEEDDKPNSLFDLSKLDVLAQLMRPDIRIEEVSTGWFQTQEKCSSGYEIFKWVKGHVKKNDDNALEICQSMMDQEVISRLDGQSDFENKRNVLYRFYEDRADIASNLLRPWKGEVGNAIDVSSELVKLIEDIYKDALYEEDEYTEIQAEEALKSPKYNSYLTKVSQLEFVDLNFNSFNEGLCFYLNVYQCMYIHCFLKNMITMRNFNDNKGLLAKILSYFRNESDTFYYNIGGFTFTLDELKHGLIRGNKKKPGSFFRVLSSSDERSKLLDGLSDPKSLFLCLDLPDVPEHIECFEDPDRLTEQLDYFLSEYFNVKVEIDTMNEEITLPKIMERYKSDLGGTDENILNFIWEHYSNEEFELDHIIKLVNRRSMIIKYEE